MLFRSLKPLLAGERPLHLIWLALGSAPIVEFAAQANPDALVLDLQHGLWERTTLEAAIGVVGRQVPVIARCAENSHRAISQALDAGAASVLVPLIETADDARRAISAGRYPPLGKRSAGGVRPLRAGLEAMLAADGEVAIGLMIETAEGVENVEAIAATPGVDYLFIGTGDLAMSRGTVDSQVIDRDCERVVRAASENGLPCGIFTGTARAVRQAFERGCRMAVSANDIDVVKDGFLDARDDARRTMQGTSFSF
ncbi:2-dehydro-3,6-dideoxy-6-sulfogluconate aldolase [Paraburkholderia caffeinitolerans]|uniref:2-dehydro-3,6-dideoxy-6-sulfogluconate aldolase n=1 Tax=Paraburkholderia caffeinitolerans TaxID=1723730 RepID=A0A6J5GF50_9BURK|nr:aldolase/citrate lyase family protein [Paraburkholderia caffeinitolerans]CAB3797770.1 2-dehydro-3,6-dideoxy-6-sulfogluconate aldolase [Paraburkholderia caffeinitolerans]